MTRFQAQARRPEDAHTRVCKSVGPIYTVKYPARTQQLRNPRRKSSNISLMQPRAWRRRVPASSERIAVADTHIGGIEKRNIIGTRPVRQPAQNSRASAQYALMRPAVRYALYCACKARQVRAEPPPRRYAKLTSSAQSSDTIPLPVPSSTALLFGDFLANAASKSASVPNRWPDTGSAIVMLSLTVVTISSNSVNRVSSICSVMPNKGAFAASQQVTYSLP